MTEWLSNSLFYGAVISMIGYEAGLLIRRRFKLAILNPLLLGVIIVMGANAILGIDYTAYNNGAQYLSYLLTPTTVCLAVPMYEQFQILKKNLPMILAGVAAGAVSCLIMVAGFGILVNFESILTISLMPKSITTAIGVALSEMMGGMPGVTTAAIVFTGIFASIMGPIFCRIFRLTDPVAQGVAFGTAGHVIGTSKANELDPLTGAVSSLSLVVAGLITAVVLPLLSNFI
jgi:predicted murein hydrolase (TIGR00659 family)